MFTVLSSSEMKFMNMALQEANKSEILMHHGAIAVVGGKVMGRGHNFYRTHSRDNFITNTCTCHAEIACLRNMFYTHNKQNNLNIKVGNE